MDWDQLEIRLSVAEDYLSVRHGLQEFKTRFANGKSRDIDVNPIELVLAEILNNIAGMGIMLPYPKRSVLNGRFTRTGFQRKFPTQALRTVRWKKLGLPRNTKIHHLTTCLKGGLAGISFRRSVPIFTIAATGISIS